MQQRYRWGGAWTGPLHRGCRVIFWSFIFALLWVWHLVPVRAEVPIPPLQSYVTDLSGTLSATQVQSLDGLLRALEQEKGAQIAVLIVPTTAPETIEGYSIRVAEAWKLGRKGVDDGVLLLVAKSDRTVRIEVGYGLEGVIPDAIAKRIVEEDIIPLFRTGDYYGGVAAGLSRLMGLVRGEPLPERAREGVGRDSTDGSLLGLVFAAFMVGSVLRRVLGRLVGAGATSALSGAAAWFLMGSFWFALLLGFFAFVFTLAGMDPRAFGSGGLSRGGGGGMRGGGGGFGGGGASGRW